LSGRDVFLGSGQGATLSPDDAEERPSHETCSLCRGDADEADALPSGARWREMPGGWEALESMVVILGVVGKDGSGVAPRRRRQKEPYLRPHAHSLLPNLD
jgi:hypothetical protein